MRIKHKSTLSGESNDGSPVASRGRIYLTTSDALYCLGREGVEPSADPLPPAPEEAPVESDQTPAHVQVTPYDALLRPGGKQSYTVRLFNARGQLLREVPASEVAFSVQGPGQLDAEGTYHAPADAAHVGASVQCKVGDVTGSARVRIVPPLPWSFDFNSGELAPISWVGGRVRYVPAEVGGEQTLMKRDVLPTPKDPNNKLGTRSQLWMGPINLANYTVQADVMLVEKNGRLPDFGLINSRYTLTTRTSNREGAAPGERGGREIRVDSWAAHDYRTSASQPFESEAGVWYRLKLRVEPQDDRALVQGKIWPRDQDEPTAWLVEMTDDRPNLQGSPGLYGNAQEAPFYVDNIKVTPND